MQRFLMMMAICAWAFVGLSCDCEEEFLDETEADRVIEGKVISIEKGGEDLLKVTFMADEEVVVIYTPSDKEVCGFPFNEGEDYVVFAYYNYDKGFYGPADSYYTIICTYTMSTSEWDELMEGLGE
jgi:hypothetical protein